MPRLSLPYPSPLPFNHRSMSATITLHNALLSVRIHRKGAELCSVQHSNGLQYMWQAGKEWPKHSPVLFPIVGTLVNNSFLYEGKSYSLPRHGFARDMEFTPTRLSETMVKFTLCSNTKTLEEYPFPFRLHLQYELHEDTISCNYEVENTGDSDMYFSIGGHPAFAVPLQAGEQYSDYQLRFSKTEPLLRWKLDNGLLGNDTIPVAGQAGNTLPLHPALFYEDAIVLKGLKSETVSLVNADATHGIHFRIAEFPHLGIWGAKDAPFVCIEPWCGHADPVNHTQDITKKPGIEQLSAGGFWQRSWAARFF